jgi:hypothetical protein
MPNVGEIDYSYELNYLYLNRSSFLMTKPEQIQIQRHLSIDDLDQRIKSLERDTPDVPQISEPS